MRCKTFHIRIQILLLSSYNYVLVIKLLDVNILPFIIFSNYELVVNFPVMIDKKRKKEQHQRNSQMIGV